MAESVITKSVIESSNVQVTNVMTGGQERQRMLYYQLKKSIRQANSIDMIVSFLMESGVKMILEDLRIAVSRGIKIRLLTGNYLGITQPSALYLIKHEFGKKVELRFYNEKERSFHPKSYLFHYKSYSEIYIGSSNISRSALTSGIEWNYKFTTNDDADNFYNFYNTFLDLFENHSIIIDDDVLAQYAKTWHKPAVLKELEKFDYDEKSDISPMFQPRGAQIEALYALEKCRKDGAERGLVQAATGIGKTYLSAFDSMGFNRVLFVAHREEILKQAAISFRNVRKSDDYGFFYGNAKTTNKSIIFASVFTLGREEYLNEKYFSKDYFDYIVIDEFHHAVNRSYLNIVDYFTPKFMLGLTATPERLDGKDIYAICNYNVPYIISLQDGINRGMLVPFRYYGIYDSVDYSAIRYQNGHYVEAELNAVYIGNKHRNDLIFKHYRRHRHNYTLGFCCSRKHAEEMAEDFSRRGVRAVAVYSNGSGKFTEARDRAISRLNKKEIDVIFSVDMFNEGVDIPSVDLVMLLRPTESPTVFLQQLGRGLRKAHGKEYLTVLDFIGNYKNIEKIPQLLSGNKKTFAIGSSEGIEYPDNCIVDFDVEIIDIFEELAKRDVNIRENIKEEFYKIKLMLGHVPSRQEFFINMDDDIYAYCKKNPKHNPFKDYLGFCARLGELNLEEKCIYNGIAKDFLNHLEGTSMTKVYKMPVLLAFCQNAEIKLNLYDDDLLDSWKKFFSREINWRDLSYVKTYKEYCTVKDSKHLSMIKNNPVKYLIKSGQGFFTNADSVIGLSKELKKYVNNSAFVAHFRDIVKYRTLEYYKSRYEANL